MGDTLERLAALMKESGDELLKTWHELYPIELPSDDELKKISEAGLRGAEAGNALAEMWNECNCNPLSDLDNCADEIRKAGSIPNEESIEDYKNRLLSQMRMPDPYKDAVGILDIATMYNINIYELVPLGGCNSLTESECNKLAEEHLFSIDDIKQYFWNGKP